MRQILYYSKSRSRPTPKWLIITGLSIIGTIVALVAYFVAHLALFVGFDRGF